MGAQVNCERNPFWTLLSPMKQWAPIQIRFGVNTTRSEPRGTQVNPESVYSGPSRSEWNPWQPRGSCCYWFRPVWTRGESRAKLVKSELTWSKRPIGTHTDTRTQKDRHTHTHTAALQLRSKNNDLTIGATTRRAGDLPSPSSLTANGFSLGATTFYFLSAESPSESTSIGFLPSVGPVYLRCRCFTLVVEWTWAGYNSKTK